MQSTLSVIIPCLNEEKGLGATYDAVVAGVEGLADDYEILIINDASTDKTGEIASTLAARNPKVRVFHNEQNMGFGYGFLMGVKNARMDYVGIIPGDDVFVHSSVRRIFEWIGKADIIIPYVVNFECRPFKRRVISRFYTFFMNTLFLCDIQYFNGPVFYRRNLLQDIKIRTSGFAFQSEALVKLIRRGASFIEVDVYIVPSADQNSSAFKLKNIFSVIWSILRLVVEVYGSSEMEKRQPHKRVIPGEALSGKRN